MKRITTKIIWACSWWGAIANPHTKVFDSPSTPKSHPLGMTPATEWKFCSICFLFVRTNTKFGIKIIEYDMVRDQARGRLGQNSRPRGRNFALIGTQGEVGVSLKNNFFFFFFFFKGDSFSFCHHTNASCGDIIKQSTTTASCFSFH